MAPPHSRPPNLATVTALIKTALENGGTFDWQGLGIGSTKAGADNAAVGSFLFGLGVLRNDLGTSDEMIGRHRKRFGGEYDDALDAIQGGTLGGESGLMGPLLWFVVAPTPDERKARHLG